MMVLPAVGAGLRFEGGCRFADGTPQATHHFCQNVVGMETQAAATRLCNDLHCDMPVSQVVGSAGEEQR